MSRCRLFVLLPLIATLPLWASPAHAMSSDGAVAHVEKLAGQALITLQRGDMTMAEREEALRPLLRQGFDIPHIGRAALGRGWSKATPQQKADYIDLFGEFIVKTTAQRLGAFVGESFQVTSARAVGDRDILVLTRLEREGDSPIAAGWRVRLVADSPKIIDVSVAGLSLSKARRSEFATLTRRQGMEGLLQVLRARVGRLSASAE